MDMITLLMAIVSVLGMFISLLFKQRSVVNHKKIHLELDRIKEESLENGLSLGPLKIPNMIEGDQTTAALQFPALIKSIEQQIASRVAASPELSKEEVKNEIATHLGEVQERLSKIESRFPEESRLEKISSINDALLSERIDQLAKQVENLEKKTLTKWDVALTVSTIIAGIAFVVGATYLIIKYLGNTP